MGFLDLGKKKEVPTTQEQIRILATNVEAINQKLLQGPCTTTTLGEVTVKKQMTECLERLKHIGDILKTRQDDIRDAVNEKLGQIQCEEKVLGGELKGFHKEREQLTLQTHKLNELISGLSKLDQKLLEDLLERIDLLNNNTYYLSQSLMHYHKGIVELLNTRINEIGENVANKLVKNTAFFIIGLIFLSAILTLLFTKFFM